jgi:hypothetical protein
VRAEASVGTSVAPKASSCAAAYFQPRSLLRIFCAALSEKTRPSGRRSVPPDKKVTYELSIETKGFTHEHKQVQPLNHWPIAALPVIM